MEPTTEILTKAALTAVGLIAVILRHRRPGRLGPKQAGTALATVAVLCTLAWPNFGFLHGRSGLHHWEQFHYFLGSKYFPELGYDGLYAASVEAQSEDTPSWKIQGHVRDLRTNEVVPTRAIHEHRNIVRERFSPERWDAFVADNDYFVRSNDVDYLRRIRLDHGYNPTPTWTFTARLVSVWLPATDGALSFLAWLDPLLMVLLFVVVFRTFGSRVGCLALIVFGIGYPWRFDWTGGAFFRQDWLAATGIAMCLMKRQRWMPAGLLLSYGAMVRVFPAAFLAGPMLVAGWNIVATRRWDRWITRLLVGFALGLVVFFCAGSMAGRGFRGWTDFRANLHKHQGTWLTNNVGLHNLLLYDTDTMTRKDVDFSLPEPWLHWQAKMDRLKHDRRPALLGATALFLLVVALAARRMTPDEAAVLGLPIVFAAVLLTCYYWVMLLFLPMERDRWGPTAAWLGCNLGLYVLHMMSPSFELIYWTMSLGMAVVFLGWLGPRAVAEFRRLTKPGT